MLHGIHDAGRWRSRGFTTYQIGCVNHGAESHGSLTQKCRLFLRSKVNDSSRNLADIPVQSSVEKPAGSLLDNRIRKCRTESYFE